MRVLVTGCAGFIGAKVSEVLARDGHDVVGIDDLNDAYDVRLKAWRLDQVRALPRFVAHVADIAAEDGLRGLEDSRPVDAVVNLAGRAGVRQSILAPDLYYRTNVEGTLRLLELCRSRGIKKFVLASTSSLYAGGECPFRENQPTDRPRSPYAASKKAAEAMCYAYHLLFGIDVAVLRYFTVYGPAGRPDMAVFRFIRWLDEDRPLIIHGDGSQERDFTYVDDVADATRRALALTGYEVINVGSDRPVSLRRMIAILEGAMGRPARLKHRPVHRADMPATWADITKARELLQWEPRTALEEGLHAAVRWYAENRAWASQIAVGD
ncbi:MAG TPA: NAD-dependent epimerase/dehydratase family protein [bacterium]|nr:NAD-dependent epimerase/dehydratase family protein [bacterium]